MPENRNRAGIEPVACGDTGLYMLHIRQFTDTGLHLFPGKRFPSGEGPGSHGIPGLEHLWLTEHIIRKTAHFAEYACAGWIDGQGVRVIPEDIEYVTETL